MMDGVTDALDKDQAPKANTDLIHLHMPAQDSKYASDDAHELLPLQSLQDAGKPEDSSSELDQFCTG